jgi:DNA polymerase V
MNHTLTINAAVEEPLPLTLPLFVDRVPAGFPSPAQDYVEDELNLHNLCVRHPSATFFLRVSGDTSLDMGMKDGDLLVIDRSLKPEHGDTIVANSQGEFIVRKLQCRPFLALIPLNSTYNPIAIDPDELDIFGVVTFFIHSTGKR